MKKIITALVAFSFVMAGVSAVDAAVPSVGDPGRFWSIPDDAQKGEVVMQFLDSSPGERGSSLIPTQGVDRYNDKDPTCANLQDPRCASGAVRYEAVVPFCAGPSDVNCTEEVGIVDESGKKTAAQFARYFPLRAQNQFAGDPLYKLPSGVAGSIFSLPAATHDGGDTYHLSVQMNGNGSNLNSIRLEDFSVQLSPVKLEDISSLCGTKSVCLDAGWSKLSSNALGYIEGKETWLNQGPGLSGSNYCVASSATEKLCAQRYAFPAGFKYYVKVRTQQLPAGWLHGRISEPDIQIKEESGVSVIEMQGFPVAVPAVYKMYRYESMPAALKDQYDVPTGAYKKDRNFINNASGYVQGGRTPESEDPLQRNNIYAPPPFSKEGMEQLNLWIPFVEDKATASLSFWSARTLSAIEMEGASGCFKDTKSVTGIVTTNATQYSAGPPAFNRAEGTLNYQVSAPHYSPDKSEFKGSYDLVMRSDVARCIYGFSKAPISATLEITSSDGTPQIATTIIGEKNGWVYLRAKNFGFSDPIIKAKLSQEPEVVVTPTPTPTPTPSVTTKPVAKKITVTCVKGKTTKKVTAVKPKCPTGFKKK
jgi:hypothetical protein